MALGRVECAGDGYRWVVGHEVGSWQDRLWSAIDGLKAYLDLRARVGTRDAAKMDE